MGEVTILSNTQNLKKDKVNIMVKHKYCSRQLELQNMNFYRFYSEATNEREFDLRNTFNKG